MNKYNLGDFIMGVTGGILSYGNIIGIGQRHGDVLYELAGSATLKDNEIKSYEEIVEFLKQKLLKEQTEAKARYESAILELREGINESK